MSRWNNFDNGKWICFHLNWNVTWWWISLEIICTKYLKQTIWSMQYEYWYFDSSSSNYSNNITLFNIKNQSHEVFSNPISEGFFFQTDIASLNEIDPYISEKCQTLTYFGNVKNDISEYLCQGRPKGIDRVVELGLAANFDLNWDGKELVYLMTKRLLWS